MKLQLIDLANTEVETDFGAEDDDPKVLVLNLQFAHINRSAALAAILAETEALISTLKAGLTATEIERVSACCKLQCARESTADVTSEEDLDVEN